MKALFYKKNYFLEDFFHKQACFFKKTGVVPQEIIFKTQQILHNDLMHNFNHWLTKIRNNADILANRQHDSDIEGLSCDIIDYCLALKDFFEVFVDVKYHYRV